MKQCGYLDNDRTLDMITCEFSTVDTAAWAMNQLDARKSKVVAMVIEHWLNTMVIMPVW